MVSVIFLKAVLTEMVTNTDMTFGEIEARFFTDFCDIPHDRLTQVYTETMDELLGYAEV